MDTLISIWAILFAFVAGVNVTIGVVLYCIYKYKHDPGYTFSFGRSDYENGQGYHISYNHFNDLDTEDD